MDEDFDGSTLRELLEPALRTRGAAPAPTDAIVAAGLRRVRGRRLTVAGGAVAAVAAVPLAVTAWTSGSGAAHSTVTPQPYSTSARPPAPPTTAAPNTTATTATTATATTTPSPTRKPRIGPLPATPKLLAEGTMNGKKWTVSGIGSGGNNELTAKSQCLKLLITDGGRDRTASLGDVLLYCDGYRPDGYLLSELTDDVPGGSGNLAIGTAQSRVAKIVTRIQGVAAPVTVQTVPAPGVDRSIFVIPVGTGISPLLDFDLYDAQGQKIGHADNYSNPPNLPMDQDPSEH